MPTGGARRTWRTWARLAMMGILVIFAVWAVAANWRGVSDALSQLLPWTVVAAVPAGFATTAVALLVWRSLLADFGHRLSLPAAGRIFFISQLGKYVPGSVWSILAQIELSRRHHIPKRTNVAVGVLAIAIAVTTGLGVAALMLPFGGGATARHYWWILLVLPVFATALHPRILGPTLNQVLRLGRREPLPRTPSGRGLSRTVGLQVLVWLCLGLQVWLLLIGLGAPPGPSLPVAIGGYALAYSLGQMAVGLPAGAGIREAALTIALSTVVPAPAALVVALVARAIMTMVDLTTAGVFAAASRHTAPRAADQNL